MELYSNDTKQVSSHSPPRHLCVAKSLWTQDSIQITGDDHHYLFRVLRLTLDSEIRVFDGDGTRVNTRVASIDKEQATLSFIAPPKTSSRVGSLFHAYVSLIKGERMDYTLEKLTELGVSEITPLVCERTIVSLDPKRAAKRLSRYAKTIRSAAQQSENLFIPSLNPITPMNEALAACQADLKLVLWARGGKPLRTFESDSFASIAYLIGPEGGLSQEELNLCDKRDFIRTTLGPRVLRADTATIATQTSLGFIWGDLHTHS